VSAADRKRSTLQEAAMSTHRRTHKGFALNEHLIRAVVSIGTVLGASCAFAADPGVAAEVRPAALSIAELERAFWVCDHAATNGAIDSAQGIACGIVTEDLKRQRFGGDFDQLLRWWRENKVAQHRLLDADDGAMP
jgi:hypothetical protein